MPGGSNTVALAEFPAARMLRHICRRGAALWLACPVPVVARVGAAGCPPGRARAGPGASGPPASGGFVMRTGAARGHAGHFHEAGFYGSDTEFRALIVPFAEEGIAAGEPVIIGYDSRKNALVRSWLTDPSAVTFPADSGPCTRRRPGRSPPTGGCLSIMSPRGAGQIRITGELPHPGNGGRSDGWDRYEAAVNTVWQDFPVWGLCLYDTAAMPAVMLDAAERTHPRIVSPTGTRRPNARFQQVADFEALPPVPDPLEQTTPMIELADKSAAEARAALIQIGLDHSPAPSWTTCCSASRWQSATPRSTAAHQRPCGSGPRRAAS